MNLSICILARNEETNIARTLGGIAEQSLFDDRRDAVEIHVVANGCTDRTVEVAKAQGDRFLALGARLIVHDLHPGGKSRAWNCAVHNLTGGADTLLFADADIAFVDRTVLERLLQTLSDRPALRVVSGHPIKDIARKSRKTLLDRFSLTVSSGSRYVDAINGSLYAGSTDVFRRIWLPNDTPGEDGFLNAMVTTHGFTVPYAPGRVATMQTPTHYFSAHDVTQYLQHERRMLVGTMINRWIFEHLWSQKLTSPAGPVIARWNEQDPDWVERIINGKTRGKRWTIPPAVLFGRLEGGGRTTLRRFLSLPIRLVAVVATLPPAIAANQRLKRRGAATVW